LNGAAQRAETTQMKRDGGKMGLHLIVFIYVPDPLHAEVLLLKLF